MITLCLEFFKVLNGSDVLLPYIGLFTRHVLSANSSIKSCTKSTRVNFSRNQSESFKIYFICKIVSNLCDFNFHDFDTLANIAENECTRKKPVIWYYYWHYTTKHHEIPSILIHNNIHSSYIAISNVI